MKKEKIKQMIDSIITEDGIYETGIEGVQLFKVSNSMRCAPAIYEPVVIAILSGRKEAILDGKSYHYGSDEYMCCTLTMPVEAGTPEASKTDPLIGVYISLNTKVLKKLALEIEQSNKKNRQQKSDFQGMQTVQWDSYFTESLYRLIDLMNDKQEIAILGEARLKELYFAIMKGEAGRSVMKAFGVGNEISESIHYLSQNLDKKITIDDLANEIGMSRSVFHRRFKEATTMSPIQFIKSMRLNSAALIIADGKNVNEAAFEVGYTSISQFSREFKRLYGTSPKQWVKTKKEYASIETEYFNTLTN